MTEKNISPAAKRSLLLVKYLVLKDLPLIKMGKMRFKLGGTQKGAPNFLPFKSIYRYVSGRNGFIIGTLNLVGNIVLLVPVGFLLLLLLPGLHWKKLVLLAVCCGLALELTELLFEVGIFDVDDILLNAIGVVLGGWLCNKWQQRQRPVQQV